MSHLRQLYHQIAKLQNQQGMSTRHGYVHEVKDEGGERKVRVVLGIKKDGSPWLSPWLHSEEQRGGTQEQHLVEEGQNVVVSNHGGDFRNATFSHSAENKSFPQPSHAPNVNGYTSEHGKLRTSHNKPKSNGGGGGGGGGGSDKHYHSVEIMDKAPENPQHQEQSGQPEQSGGGQQSGQQQQGGQQSKAKSVVSTSIHESDGCTGRVGEGDKAARYASHTKGAKICMGDFAVWVNDKGCYSSKPIQLKKCDIPNNNA